jgi:hypothetical protein
MVCEANWKDRLAYATFWMALLAVVAILLGSCNQGAQGKGDGGPPPPPYECEYEEEEYNDTLDEANFVNILPVLGGNHHICGELYHWGQGNDGDVDTFYFFMNPTQGQETLFINFVVESDPQVIPKVRLSRTIYDINGQPTGDYEVLGIFYGDPSSLVVLDFPLKYEDLTHNDLFVELTAAAPYPVGIFDYKIDYWSF